MPLTHITRTGPPRSAWSRLAPVVLPILALLLTVALWWTATIAFAIPPFLLPAPPAVTAALRDHPVYLAQQSATTLIVVLEGFAIAIGAGALIGTAIAASHTLEQAVYPLLAAINSLPKAALAPLLLVWLGLGHAPRITMAVLFCFFPIVLGVADGLIRTPTELVELARSMVGTPWQILTKVRLPAALPSILVGLKVAIPLAVVGTVIGELQGGDSGLGYVIATAGGGGDIALAFAAIVLLAIMSVLLFQALAAAQRALPWADPTGTE